MMGCVFTRRSVRVIFTLTLLSFAVELHAATVRGRLVRNSPNGQYPAPGVQVTVLRPDIGRSGASFSGPDGMYYLYNIPPGPCVLEVWVNNPPWTYNINVINQAFSDVVPLAVP